MKNESGFFVRSYFLTMYLFIILFYQTAYCGDPPFGAFETPLDGSTARGEVQVTGWALDDVGVESVKIYYGFELNFIGDAVFVAGARPDIEASYPGYPNNDSAGWGYQLLTNFLPNGGNGTYTLYAIAKDVEGNEVTLGSKTIICDNDNAVKPFGTLEKPEQGGTASGNSYFVSGWALTPMPNTIPADGSTIIIYVDGVPLGNPVYNQYREDIATLFPGYNNSDGAMFYYYLDTTQYSDGLHTIYAKVTDDAGNTEGIGSRYFTIDNDDPLPVCLSSFQAHSGNDCITLDWKTESQTNNLGFILERSDDRQISWREIAHYKYNNALAGEGNSSCSCEYTFIEKAYPNPFNPETCVRYHLAQESRVNISVYDMLGRFITSLYDGPQHAGSYDVIWKGENSTGDLVPSGIYLIVLRTEKCRQAQKVMLVK